MLNAQFTDQLKRRFRGDPLVKFCTNPNGWYLAAQVIAAGLGMAEPAAQMRILDLGCGPGYFLRVCGDFGHEAEGIDLPHPLLQTMTQAMGVTYHPHTIKPGKPLPMACTGYDLITTFGVNFRDGGEYWTAENYAWLAADIRHRLTASGCWVLRPNVAREPGSPLAGLLHPDWWWKVAPDATINISRHEVQIKWA